MRVGAEWIFSKENFVEGEEPDWIGVGLHHRRPRRPAASDHADRHRHRQSRRLRKADGGTSVLARIGAVLTSIILAAYVVAMWAMSAKPG